MKRTTLVLFVLAVTVAATPEFVMRSGRWEVRLEMKLPGELPAGMPLAQPTTMIDCLTEDVVMNERNPMPMPDASCKVSNYRHDAGGLKFTMTCDDAAFDYQLTRVSTDEFRATGVSHGRDPSQRITMNMTAKRTGNACSARELAEAREREG